ncbi:uncharacterized protein LOC128960103 [Oppia nitens]|uniref:uncharacterized protein LOC128960103 n=1 Tax=Oppia nitens TaxID=1686743 RepID=UPI0023DC4312|nr:uncharacterized protein LOC128960103 [Oppia nitens]
MFQIHKYLFQLRYLPLISLSTTYYYRYHRGQHHQRMSSKLWSQFAALRTTHLSNGQTVEPFTRDWFMPYVAIKANLSDAITGSQTNSTSVDFLCSGFLYNSIGLILADNDKFSFQTLVTVCFADGSEAPGRVVTRRDDIRLAIIKLDGQRTDWPCVRSRNIDIDPLQPAETVYTVSSRIGNPNLMEGYVVSAERLRTELLGDQIPYNIDLTQKLIQHTAFVHKLDVVTALVDTDGLLVGINIIYFQTTINVAMSITNIIKFVLHFGNAVSLNAYGVLTYWYDPSKLIKFIQWGVPVNKLPNYAGVLVYRVFCNPGAIDVKQYDLITHANCHRLNSWDDWLAAVECGTDLLVSVNEDNYHSQQLHLLPRRPLNDLFELTFAI